MPARGRPKRTTRTSRGQTSESSNNLGMKMRVRNVNLSDISTKKPYIAICT
jgi:hypothetical protein